MGTGKDRLKRLGRLDQRKVREAEGLQLLEGPRLVGEALEAGRATHLFVRDEAAATSWIPRAGDVPVEIVGPRGLEILSTVRTPQDVVAVGPLPELEPAERIVQDVPRLLWLEGIQDPGNAGTLARTAEALGIKGLVLGPGTADPAHPKVLRASAGSLLRLRLARIRDAGELLPHLARAGTRLVVPLVSGGRDLTETPSPRRFCLVAGNEGKGSELGEAPGALGLTIPMVPACESLNVTAAIAVILGRWLDRSSPEFENSDGSGL